MGIIDARQGTVPANIESLFPDPWNADTWNLAAISPNVRTYTIGVGQNKLPFNEPKSVAWVQDDWHLTQKLTLNLGARYDLIWDPFANWVALEPWMKADRPQDANNVQPRLGFAYSLNDKTVIRGGSGKYYADVVASNWTMSSRSLSVAFLQFPNDGRADFAANPLNGAPLRRRHGDRVGLRLPAWTRREGAAGQREHYVQSRHRRALSLLEPGDTCISGMGRGRR